jgi:hypothetical protein
MLKLKELLIGTLLFGKVLLAQNLISLSQATIYDENIFRNYAAESDWVSQTAFSGARELEVRSSHVRFYYQNELNYFKASPERWFHFHKLGNDWAIPVTRHVVNLGFSWQRRFDQPDYQLYDYSGWLGYADMRLNLGKSLPIEIGYHLRARIFHELDQFSFREHAGFFRLKHFFPTKTTLIAEINLAAKTYLEKQIVSQLIIQTDTLNSPGRGHGAGNQKLKLVQDTSLVAANLDAPQTNQLSLLVKIAQSITPTTGLSLQYLRRFQPVQATRYLAGQAYTYTRDDELYDDPYTYGGQHWELALTQMLPWASRVRFFANFDSKNYLYKLSGASDENRQDTAWLLGWYLTKNLTPGKWVKNIELYLSYFYLENQSNEPYYDANGAVFSGGFNFNF